MLGFDDNTLRALAVTPRIGWTIQEAMAAAHLSELDAYRGMSTLIAYDFVWVTSTDRALVFYTASEMPTDLLARARIDRPDLRIGAPLQIPDAVEAAVWGAAPSRATYRQRLLSGGEAWSGAGVSKWGAKNHSSRDTLLADINAALPTGWTATVPKLLSGTGQARRWRRTLCLNFEGYQYEWRG